MKCWDHVRIDTVAFFASKQLHPHFTDLSAYPHPRLSSASVSAFYRNPTQNNNYNTQYRTYILHNTILNSITQYWYIQETISVSTILTNLQRTILNTSLDNWSWWQTSSKWLLQQINIKIYHNLSTIYSTHHWNLEQVQYSFMGSEYLHFTI